MSSDASMMQSATAAVQVRGLSKAYQISHRSGPYTTIREALIARLRHPLRRRSEHEAFWALSDVSFDVQRGEVLGIVGRNGAGKSTLLKIISRVTEPTTGEIRLRGNVGSLLEVGTGFHPELTGRENIFLNGTILGMRRREIRTHFDEIVDFAGVERFLDTPVKRYSSGMYVRLAFSIAAHLNSDILIVDEVLAVGDAEFQAKCLGRMRDVSTSGRTVFFVSHNIAAMRSLCTTAMLLHEGRVMQRGTLESCIQSYVADSRFHIESRWTRDTSSVPTAALTIDRVDLELRGEQPTHELSVGLELSTHAPHRPGLVTVDILDAAGGALMQASPTVRGFIPDQTRHHRVQLTIQLPPLVPGQYLVSVWVGGHNSDTYDLVKECAGFEVHFSPTPGRTFVHTVDHGYIVPHSSVRYGDKPVTLVEADLAG